MVSHHPVLQTQTNKMNNNGSNIQKVLKAFNRQNSNTSQYLPLQLIIVSMVLQATVQTVQLIF